MRAISHPPKLAFSSFRTYFLKYTEIQMYRKSFLFIFAAVTSLFCFALYEAQTMTSKLIVSLLAHESRHLSHWQCFKNSMSALELGQTSVSVTAWQPAVAREKCVVRWLPTSL